MTESISEKLADAITRAGGPPREIAEKLLIDVAGLCVAARNTDYVRAALAGWEASGKCTAIGHARGHEAPYFAPARRIRQPHTRSAQRM